MDTLLAKLRDGHTVVTPGRPLTRHLAQRHDMQQLRAGRSTWVSPDVLPWDAWLLRLWTQACEGDTAAHGVLVLTEAQELALWESIIEDELARSASEEAALWQLPAAARAAREAFSLLRQWRLEPSAFGARLSEDHRVFRRWAERFDAVASERGWLDRGRLAAALLEPVRRGGASCERPVVVAGFDELSPLQRALVEALRDAGASVDVVMPAAHAHRVARAALADSDGELEAAACWARARLEEDGAGPVGIIVPDLASTRERVRRHLEDRLTPAALTQLGGPSSVFHLSLGRPLSEVPMVATALTLLALGSRRLEIDELSRLLRSPFLLGGDEEAGARALVDAGLRAEGVEAIGLDALRARLARERAGPRACARLLDALQAATRRRPPPRRLPPPAWAQWVARWLSAFGWPGERALDSEEFQALQAWSNLLSEFAALGLVVGGQSHHQALALLARLARERIFQAEGGAAPVQVMGMLEAAGMTFSHLWVAGLDDESWPPGPRPNPFIPCALQRQHRMPRADAERERSFAALVTARLLGAAGEVVVSHAVSDGERRVRPSPLIAAVPEHPVTIVAAPRHRDVVHSQRPRLEPFNDFRAGPIERNAPVRGGAELFRDQAVCPFRAFARRRLAARRLEFPAPGLDPRERGTLMHRALEAVWASLGSHAALMAESQAGLADRVAGLVGDAVDAGTRQRRSSLSARFIRLEKQRLTELVLDWLALERVRDPFEVMVRESERTVRVGGVTVEIRPDRVDRVAGGTLVVIDYKSGQARVGDWLGERPREPQLLLYRRALGEAVGAVAFAIVRRGASAFRGLARREGLAPGITVPAGDGPEDAAMRWQQWVASSDEVLLKLADDFAQGVAEVNPLAPSDCRGCEVRPLCRVDELHRRRTGAAG